jgi:hypothetical protein
MLTPRKLLFIAPLLSRVAFAAQDDRSDDAARIAENQAADSALRAALQPVAPLVDPYDGQPLPGNVRQGKR